MGSIEQKTTEIDKKSKSQSTCDVFVCQEKILKIITIDFS